MIDTKIQMEAGTLSGQSLKYYFFEALAAPFTGLAAA